MISFDSPVATVFGSHTKKRDAVVKGLGLTTVGDLMRHFPRRYVETEHLTKLEGLEVGQFVAVVGEVVENRTHQYQDRRTGRRAFRVEVLVSTDGPPLRITLFAKNAGTAQWHADQVPVGRRGIFLGDIGQFRREWSLTNPRMILFGTEDDHGARLGKLYPVYPLTKGVDTADLQRAIGFARTMLEEVPDPLPAEVVERHRLLDARTAYEWIHAPDDHGQVERARKRFRFEEALVTQLVLARRRRLLRAEAARPRTGGGGLLEAFDARLPFELTAGQRAVGAEIEADLAQPHPMNRLLQGEVGSGKTLVALRAMLRVVDSGGQAALLAPTEVLAQQHHRSITAMLGDLAHGGLLTGLLGGGAEGTSVELLTGSMTKSQRTGPMSRLASGEAGIVIGTHALLEDKVQFADLGLVVVDEQHRFGVEQRAALTDKAGAPPHVLVMTATPIPRTVAMTVFGDLETSTLSELPAGRAPIQTNVVPLADQPSWEARVWQRVREEVGRGHQVYVVCPRISSETEEQGTVLVEEPPPADEDLVPGRRPAPPAAPSRPLAAVEDVATMLADGPLEGLRLAVLHGRLPAEEKERTMRAFADGEVDVLVATTVIEVGVDVANATTMVLLDAERFGISQLHQLRGRVGRGGLPGLCLLVTHAEHASDARERLDAVASTTDGFELSRVDLELRREGDVLGASQSGVRSSLQNLRVLRDEATIVAARETAGDLLDTDPDLLSWPHLEAAVTALERSAASEFLEKS